MRARMVLLGASIFLFIALAAFLRKVNPAELLEIPPCFRIGGDLHHYFEPNCQGTSPISGIKYAINEDGLRERERKKLGLGAVMVLGDSFVEGKGIEFSATLSQVLERKLKKTVINAGVRSRGPVLESLELKRLSQIYKPSLVIWVLNENDVFDDKFAYSLKRSVDQNAVPLTLSIEDFESVSWLSDLRAKLGSLGVIFDFPLYFAYRRSVEKLVLRENTGFTVCGGVQRGIEIARKQKTPLFFVLTPLGPNSATKGMDFATILPCLAGETVLDLREALNQKEFFLQGDTHLNPHGVEQMAELLRQAISVK
jgi:hypothetical protein